MATFGRYIANLRESLRLSLQDVADRAAISKAHLWEMEKGTSVNPGIATVCALGVALDVDPKALADAAIRDHMKTIKVEVTTSKRVKR